MHQVISFSFILLTVIVSCSTNGEFSSPVEKPLMEAVYASGYVVSENEYQVFAQVDGYITARQVKDGDAVKKGDVLFIIEADQQNARYRIARENYELARENAQHDSPVFTELRAAVSSAKSKMQFDSVNFVRFSNMMAQNATSRAEYDRSRLAYENSRNDFLLADSRLKKTINQLNTELRNAENQYRIARDESARYTIRSQVDGTVYRTFKEQGELIRRTEVIAVVGSADAYYLQLNIDELDIQRVREGQPVLVKIDAYPQQIFNAEITRIYPLVDGRQQSFRADAKLREKLPGGFSGLALEANIVIRKTDQALVIPKAALLPGDSVIVKTSSGQQRVKIIKGIETLDEIEVLEGLTASSLIKIKP
ncbi:MAG: HlyD family efflux transporter periplasmic adaptor subunit [Cyclobacteriaceae bacterium]|nr:HlyD family efflux transporter periplasmic adaptor subunit [Cyclobacteriaceae bacterium]UYN86287.1 MAG: HlyD family efflux transporter periplasmic adaptor subunit [Cyclobacteriaceae bacterium]